jgi:hypothetical protein
MTVIYLSELHLLYNQIRKWSRGNDGFPSFPRDVALSQYLVELSDVITVTLTSSTCRSTTANHVSFMRLACWVTLVRQHVPSYCYPHQAAWTTTRWWRGYYHLSLLLFLSAHHQTIQISRPFKLQVLITNLGYTLVGSISHLLIPSPPRHILPNPTVLRKNTAFQSDYCWKELFFSALVVASTWLEATFIVLPTHSAMSSLHWSTMIFRFVIASKIVLLSFANHFGGNLPAPTSPLYLF